MGMGLVAYKCGMTRFFTSDGLSIPVTVVKVYSNYVVGIRVIDDNFCSVKISAGFIKKKKVIKPIKGFYDSIGIESLKYMYEFCVLKNCIKDYSIGDELSISMFNILDKINVVGMSKGRGFAGVIKRHNFRSQKASHGNSLSHRAPGSIGQCQTPGRVFKGKKMAGRMGNSKVTVRNLEIINIYSDLNVVLLKGAIPGASGNKILLKRITN